MATDPTMQDQGAPSTDDGPDKITVCIEIDTDGSISVGVEPPDDEGAEQSQSADGMTDLSQPQDDESSEDSYMKPVKSIDEALRVARDLLQNAGQVGPAMEQDAANTAFKSRRPMRGGM